MTFNLKTTNGGRWCDGSEISGLVRTIFFSRYWMFRLLYGVIQNLYSIIIAQQMELSRVRFGIVPYDDDTENMLNAHLITISFKIVNLALF